MSKVATIRRKEDKMTTEKKSMKKILLGLAALVVVIVALFFAYKTFGAKPVEGSKAISIEVIGSDKNSKVYDVKTDAEYLRGAMEEAEGLIFEGDESDFGLMVHTINGETAIYEEGAYWGYYINGDYCNYGIDSQPIADGDQFLIEYTLATE